MSRFTLIILALYAGAVYFYLITRFNGSFVEADTYRQSLTIYKTLQANSMLESSTVYSNGFVYTAISVFLLNVTGISLQSLQIIIYPLLTFLLVPVIFITYRQLTDDTRIAIFATLLIFLQPDFLFVTFRGSHERITWLFSLLLLFCISKSFIYTNYLGVVLRFMLIFYLTTFALVSINVLFASSFMVGLILSFVGGYLLLLLRGRFKVKTDESIKLHMRRLFYIAISFSIFLYLFIFYLYPPSLNSLQSLGALGKQVAVLTLNAEPAQQTGQATTYFDPYTTFVSFSTPVYLALTMFSWFMLLVSALGWLKQGYNFFRTSVLSRDSLSRFVLWLIYAAYALQLLISVFSDRSDALSGNLQTRIFTPLNLLVMPLAALTIWEFFQALKSKPLRRIFMIVGVLAIMWFSGASLLKASIDPLVGNKWIFNTVPEQIAGQWIYARLPKGSDVWAGYDERLSQGANFNNLTQDLKSIQFSFTSGQFPLSTYYYFSTVEKFRWFQSGRPLLDFEANNRIYDNGIAFVYRRVARTPYE